MYSQFFPNSGVLDVIEAKFQLSFTEIVLPLLIAIVHSVARRSAEKWSLVGPSSLPWQSIGSFKHSGLHSIRAEKGMISEFLTTVLLALMLKDYKGVPR